MDIHTRITAPSGRPRVVGHTVYDAAVHDVAGIEDIGVYVVALRMIDTQGCTSAAELGGESRGLTPELVLASVERLVSHGLLVPLAEPEQLLVLPPWARTRAKEYLAATAGTEQLQNRITAVFTEPGNPEAHTLQTPNDATTKLQAIRDDLRTWQHALEDLHAGLHSAPASEPAGGFLAQEAGRFVTTVLHLHEAAASRLLDGPFGPTETDKSLRLRFDGTRLLTPSGAIALTGLNLPSTAAAPSA